jgi:hypothetical protein
MGLAGRFRLGAVDCVGVTPPQEDGYFIEVHVPRVGRGGFAANEAVGGTSVDAEDCFGFTTHRDLLLRLPSAHSAQAKPHSRN